MKTELNNNTISHNDKTNENNFGNKLKLIKSSSVAELEQKKTSGKTKLPPLKPYNFNKRIIQSNLNKSNNINIIYNKCNECYLNKILKYCRACNKFLCYNCSTYKNNNHKDHINELMDLIPNSNSANIIKYKNIIENQLKESLPLFNKIDVTKDEKKIQMPYL